MRGWQFLLLPFALLLLWGCSWDGELESSILLAERNTTCDGLNCTQSVEFDASGHALVQENLHGARAALPPPLNCSENQTGCEQP